MRFIYFCLKMRNMPPVAGLVLFGLAMVISMQNCSRAVDSGDTIAQSSGNGGSYGGANWLGFSCEGFVKSGDDTIQVTLSKDEFGNLKLRVYFSETDSAKEFPVNDVTSLGLQTQYSGLGVIVTVDSNSRTGLIQFEDNGVTVTHGLACL